jgi:hypothetical protein
VNKKKEKTIGFGLLEWVRHYHRITITKHCVSIEEIFESGKDFEIIDDTRIKLRAIVSRSVWDGIAETAERDFNRRLAQRNLKTGTWKSITIMDRLLGKELLVLIWAAEQAQNKDEIRHICGSWSQFSPEERWWLSTMTAAATGAVGDRHGWRKALYYGLSGRSALQEVQRVAS